MVFPLAGKAIGAIEVAGVGNMQAQGLDYPGAALLQLSGLFPIGIRGEELPLFL